MYFKVTISPSFTGSGCSVSSPETNSGIEFASNTKELVIVAPCVISSLPGNALIKE